MSLSLKASFTKGKTLINSGLEKSGMLRQGRQPCPGCWGTKRSVCVTAESHGSCLSVPQCMKSKRRAQQDGKGAEGPSLLCTWSWILEGPGVLLTVSDMQRSGLLSPCGKNMGKSWAWHGYLQLSGTRLTDKTGLFLSYFLSACLM